MPTVGTSTADLSDVIPALIDDASAQETRADNATSALLALQLRFAQLEHLFGLTLRERHDHVMRYENMRESLELHAGTIVADWECALCSFVSDMYHTGICEMCERVFCENCMDSAMVQDNCCECLQNASF